ncbi:MAG TPA: hypothetical protein VF916_09495, partial [Ktedonobacterales bacterium]
MEGSWRLARRPGSEQLGQGEGQDEHMAVIPVEELKQRPDWLRVRVPTGENYEELRSLMRSKALHTVCEEARCPNIA